MSDEDINGVIEKSLNVGVGQQINSRRNIEIYQLQRSENCQIQVPIGVVVPMWGRKEKPGQTFIENGVTYYVLGDGDNIKNNTELYNLASKYLSKPRYPESIKNLAVKGGPNIIKINGKTTAIDNDEYWDVMRGVYGTTVKQEKSSESALNLLKSYTNEESKAKMSQGDIVASPKQDFTLTDGYASKDITLQGNISSTPFDVSDASISGIIFCVVVE